MFINTGSILCPYCDTCSWVGEVSFIKERARKHIRENHTVDTTPNYKRLEFQAIIRNEIKQAHRKKNVANKDHNIIDEYYYAGVYSGLMTALVKSNNH